MEHAYYNPSFGGNANKNGELMRIIIVIGILALEFCGLGKCGILRAAELVSVSIAGTFSTDPGQIRTNATSPFPMPSLLGGSFAGSFEYRKDATRIPLNPLDFPFNAVSIAVFDNGGTPVHTIELLRSGTGANPLKVGSGNAIVCLGYSDSSQPGHLPEMPTDIRFGLLNDAFSFSSVNPPSASDLNSAVLSDLFGFGAFVELDDADNPSIFWDLPIVSLSIHAQEVPEPATLVVLGIGVLASMGRNLSRRS